MTKKELKADTIYDLFICYDHRTQKHNTFLPRDLFNIYPTRNEIKKYFFSVIKFKQFAKA